MKKAIDYLIDEGVISDKITPQIVKAIKQAQSDAINECVNLMKGASMKSEDELRQSILSPLSTL